MSAASVQSVAHDTGATKVNISLDQPFPLSCSTNVEQGTERIDRYKPDWVVICVSQVSSEPNRAKGIISLKDLCPDDKRRIANLIEELAK